MPKLYLRYTYYGYYLSNNQHVHSCSDSPIVATYFRNSRDLVTAHPAYFNSIKDATSAANTFGFTDIEIQTFTRGPRQ